MTIEELSRAAGMHPTYLSGIERGVRNPTWAKLCALADALDLPVWILARDAELRPVISWVRGPAGTQ